MKNVRVDKLGRIVIPITIRCALAFYEGSELEACLEGDRVILRHASDTCRLCYTRIERDAPMGLCCHCVEKVKEIDVG